MEIKLIATDVDGTLVADNHLTIPDENIEAFALAKKKGVITVISTGRPYSLAKRESDTLNGVDYMIVSNGAAIVDMTTNEVIYSCYLPFEAVEKIVRVSQKYDI